MSAIEIKGVSKSFGKQCVLEDVTLNVPEGETFAFLGRNGQGKTTTILMMLGLLKRDSGCIEIGGADPATQPLGVRQSVGYLAEDQRMFGWMTVDETIGFTKSFYAKWDDSLAAKLKKDFELAPEKKVRQLSKGQNIRLGLLLALAHRPKIVILDDPTLGLDPIMRKSFLRDVIEHLQGGGATVFFSSHLLYEVEPIADSVAILDRGRIVRQEATDILREDVKQIILSAEDYSKGDGVPGLLDAKVHERRAALIVENAEEAGKALSGKGIGFEEKSLCLDDIFEAYVIGNRGRGQNV